MRSRAADGILIVSLGLAALTAAASTLPAPTAELDTIVTNSQQAVDGDQDTTGVESLELGLTMQDHGHAMDGDYKVTRDGRMRIDILQDGKRVYTEAYDGHRGWDQGQDGSSPVVDPHGEALWHGTQFPGLIFSLSDMQKLGHKLEYQGRELVDGVDYYVLKLTLSDGFVTYRYVNPKTWLIDRGRDFRAFHPGIDPHQTWVETRWSDYRPVEGSRYPFASVNVDLNASQELASQRVTSLKVNPKFDPALFQMPAAPRLSAAGHPLDRVRASVPASPAGRCRGSSPVP